MIEITGRSLACLVAADVLARSGREVSVTGTGPLGRSFAPLTVDDRRLELGARLLELSYDDDAPLERRPLLEYTGGDHRPWMGWVRDYIEGLVVPRPVPLFMERRLMGRATDFLLTGDLRALGEACSAKELRAIEADALLRLRHYPVGLGRRDLAQFSYREASRLLHGDAFHATFIGPLLDAILGPRGDVAATEHRKVWLPLFTPGEIVEACHGASGRPRRHMALGMGEAVDALVARLEPYRHAGGSADRIRDPDPVEGPTLDLHVAWLHTDLSDRVTWFYQDPVFPYRETIIDGIMCWEAGPAWPASWPSEAITSVSVNVPLTDPPVDPRAGVIGSGSFNSQVVQGLAAAAHRLET